MKVNAIYENGRLTFPTPMLLKSARVEVVVEIPDAEIDAAQLDESSIQLLRKLEAIRNAPIPPEWEADPSDKEDRIDAYSLYRRD